MSKHELTPEQRVAKAARIAAMSAAQCRELQDRIDRAKGRKRAPDTPALDPVQGDLL